MSLRILSTRLRVAYRVEAMGAFEFAVGGAPAEGRLPARIIRKDEIGTAVRGAANAARGVSTLLDSDDITERLTVYKIHTPSGNWSSFPPHRHDTRDNYICVVGDLLLSTPT